jgi:hypothetical protein
MDELKHRVSNALEGIQIDFGGGCSVSKGYLMAWLIRKYQITSSLDIGVYRGRSLISQAVAHQEYTDGMAYGVDPWIDSEARENDNPDLREAINKFIDTTNFSAIYEGVAALILKLNLGQNCTLVRATSCDAIRYFERKRITFGLIHIDGNHDSDRVMEDISLYLPRLRRGGFILMDDVSWDSIKFAYAVVAKRFYRIYQRTDQWNDYAVFWDAPSWAAASLLRGRLILIGRD